MFKALKKFVYGEEKPKVNDILFNLMYFTDVEVNELMKSVRTDEDFITKVLIPFNFMIIPLLLGARCIKTKNGNWSLLFNEYSLSEKETKQILFLVGKFYNFSESFYETLTDNSSDDIENIPEPLISFKKVRISEIPESLFGKNGSDGIIAQRIDPITAQRLVDEGKEIGAAIKKKAILMEVGIGTLIGAALGVGGYYMYNRKDDESTDDETVVTTENEDDVIDVEPVEDIVVVSTDEM